MEKKKYETPVTEIVNIGAESELLDWIITSIRDGQGDVDAQEGFFEEEEEDWINVWTLLSGHYATRQKGKITETFTHLYIYTL